jgi:probable phosphoglycerate mutase
VHAERSDLRLREVSWGEWDGLTIADIKQRYPEMWQAHIADRWNVGAPGGRCAASISAFRPTRCCSCTSRRTP